MKQQFLKEIAGTIRLSVYDANRPVVPSSGTITLYNPGGGELLTATAVTIDGTTGEMTYALTTSHTATHDLNYKAVWAYVIAGETFYQTTLFDVVKSILAIPITDDDLYNEMDSLRDTNLQYQGTATAGAAGTITDTKARKEADNFFKGGVIETLAGTGSGQTRDVTGNVQSTGVVSVSPNWTTNPDTTTVYRIIKSFTSKIHTCFEEVETMLYNKGRRHSLVLESSQIKFPLLFLTLAMICLDLSNEEGDQWDRKRIVYHDKFIRMFDTMKLDYDADESGSVQGVGEEGESVNSLRISRT